MPAATTINAMLRNKAKQQLALVQQTLPNMTPGEIDQARLMVESDQSPIEVVRILLQHRRMERSSTWSDTLGNDQTQP